MQKLSRQMHYKSLALGATMFVVVLGASTRAQASWPAAKGHFERSFSVSGTVDLDVHTGCGDVQVRAGAGNSVEVDGKIEVSHGFSGNAEQRVKEIETNPPVQQTGNIIHITQEPSSAWRNVCVSYTITTPQHTDLKARTGSGNVQAEGIAGPVDAESGSGDVNLQNIGGMARVHTGSGNVRAERIRGEASFETGSGDVQAFDVAGAITGRTGSGNLKLRQSAPGPMRAETGSGEIDLSGTIGSLRASTGSGSIKADGDPKGPWHLSTGSGEVELHLPANASAELSAHSSSGSVNVSRPLSAQGTVGHKEVHGRLGNGGPMIEVSTGSGDISIR